MSKISTITELLRITYRKTRVTGDNFIAAVYRMIYLLMFKRFAPKELILCAFHLPSQTKDLPYIFSKEDSLSILSKYNDPKLADLTENKDVFYRICRENGIRVPQHVFTAVEGDENLENIRRMLRDENGDQKAYAHFPKHFIKKDLTGAYARGFEMFSKHEGGFKKHDGQMFNSKELIDYLTHPSNNECVVQERIYSHPELAKFSGTDVAQSARMGTVRLNGEKPKATWFQLKVIGRGNITDNYHGGRVGNTLTYGDIETGILKEGIIGCELGMGNKVITHHLDTKRPFNGFQIPFFKETKELACKAHDVFHQFGIIGWDIAIAEDGPVVLEGNIWTDLPLVTPSVLTKEDWKLFAN